MKCFFCACLIASTTVLLSTGCSRAETPIASHTLTSDKILSAVITPNAIITGSLESGASAYLSKQALKDTETPNYRWRMHAEENPPVNAVAYSAAASKAITAAGSNLVIWNTQTGEALHHLSAPGLINAIAMNRAGTLAVLGLSNNTATVIDLTVGGVKQTYKHRSQILSVAIYGERWVLTGEERNRALLWQLNSDEPEHELIHQDGVTLVGFSPDGSTAVSASRYDEAKFWEVEGNHAEIATIDISAMALKAGKRLIGFEYLSAQQLVTAYSDRTAELIDLQQSEPLRKWSFTKKMLFAKDGAAVIAVGKYHNNIIALSSDGKAHVLIERNE